MTKKKPIYSLTSNLLFILRNMWKINQRLTVYAFLRAPFMVLTPFLAIWLSKTVVGAVTDGKKPHEVLFLIGLFSLATLVSLLLQKYLSWQLEYFKLLHDFTYQSRTFKKAADSDYENMESPSGLTRLSKALEFTENNTTGGRVITEALSSFVSNCIGIVAYATMLTALSPWILTIVIVSTGAGFFLLNSNTSWMYRNKDNWKSADRKLEYLRVQSGDFTRAKDIRLYGMAEWLGNVFAGTLAERKKWFKKEQALLFRSDSFRAFLSLTREAAAYGYLIYLLYAEALPVADFVLYFGLIGGFAAWLNGIVLDCGSIRRVHLSVSEYREFLDYPDRSNHGEGIPLPQETFSIEFKHVSFRYPGSDTNMIDDLSFTIKKGEKLAIVGLNGAGKTTLVKLMCGLYTPTEGDILIDDNPINAYNRQELYTLFAVVFQEIFLMPMSIARNVTARKEEQMDMKNVEKVLRLAGLHEKVDSLPQGVDTPLIRSTHDDAVDLSGGETQRLALARALYKEGKALILDEPTAALDPIAESNIYQKYNAMTAGRTSVFISHRLASTRFCDRIIFLEKGSILECGSHDELMCQKGKYYEMFEIQSHYYRDEAGEAIGEEVATNA